ncbi:3-oxoacyl-ACP reductase [Reticulibacter mediterranei]|uniref:3-oxoacyl-ACP reductase n=1 Tax=Reticulibacter mediterranei TaxID=2778369 RepID=A0A8J3IP65_9CHLR|nr:SDR family NAD(P)-dependent oxidoreductase [Reticulibacter mediterranei]GHO98186.1 3-oxoacyl-ACP reductase [Reticulibacter mediterranei]
MSSRWNIQEKTVLVTGGTRGIGHATATALAALGATVIITGRHEESGANAIASIKQATGNPKVSFVQADLASLAGARHLADYITNHFSQLHVLINNAGGTNREYKITADGLEATFATNHASIFLLTHLLLPLLKSSAPARILNVNSIMHRSGHINFANLQAEKGYDQIYAYRQAKLANLHFTYTLARRLQGTSVTVNAVDPLGTYQGARSIPQPLAIRLILPFFKWMPIERAARSSIYMASSPDVDNLNGKYINFRKKVIRSSPTSYDESIGEQLWSITADLVGLEQKSLSY